jgi:HSP20 family protein
MEEKFMSLIRWSPFLEPWGEWDKLFKEFHKGGPVGFSPATDIYEKGNDLIVELQLPGIDPEKVDVSVEEDVLTVQGQAEKKTEVEDKNYYRKEIHHGSFYRSIPLPAHVEGDKASAAFDDGILKISIPKKKATKAKKVSVAVKKKTK